MNLNRITFRLPQPGATAVTETSREFDTNGSATAVSQVGLVKDGAEITFFLGQPENRTYVDGEFCLRWSLPAGTAPLQFVAVAPGPEEPEEDDEQHPGVELLTRAQTDQLGRSLKTTPHKRRARLVPKRVPFVPSSARPPAAGALVSARKGPVDTSKQKREREIHRLVCDALRGHPDRPKICDQP